jgi:hypothetical protein
MLRHQGKPHDTRAMTLDEQVPRLDGRRGESRYSLALDLQRHTEDKSNGAPLPKYSDGETASARSDNEEVKLLREGYDAAKKAADAECAKSQGTKCRKAEGASNKARERLSEKPAERVVDSMAVRISAALPFLTAANVEL